MKLTLEIPDEFATEFIENNFDDTLGRIRADVHAAPNLSGKYQFETLDILREAFKEAKEFTPDNTLERLKNIVNGHTVCGKTLRNARFDDTTPFEREILDLAYPTDTRHSNLWMGDYDNEQEELHMNFSAAYLIKPNDEGLKRAEVMDLLDTFLDEEVIPHEIQGESSSALGFIKLSDADHLNYEYFEETEYYNKIKEILNDKSLENDSDIYAFYIDGNAYTVYISYGDYA